MLSILGKEGQEVEQENEQEQKQDQVQNQEQKQGQDPLQEQKNDCKEQCQDSDLPQSGPVGDCLLRVVDGGRHHELGGTTAWGPGGGGVQEVQA